MRGGIGVLLCATLAIGCPSVEQDPPVTTSAKTIAVFAPDSANPCNSVLPYPSDLSKDPETGLLSLPFCPDDSAQLSAFKAGINTLDGYSINGTMTTNFSAPIDSTTIDGSVIIINAATGAPHPVGQTLFVPADNLLTIFPGEPFDEGTQYVVVITDDLKDADGGDIISDQVFTLLKSDTPLVDANGYSVIGLDDASASSLELLRQAWQPIFDGAAAAGVSKENVLVAWAFTTQTVTDSYDDLAALVAGGASVTRDNSIGAVAHPLLGGLGIPISNICQIHTGRVTLKNLLTEAGTFGAGFMSDEVVDYVLYTPNIDQNQPPDPLNPQPTLDCSAGQPDVDFSTAAFQGVVVFAHTLSRCKNVSVTIANTFGSAGWAVLALDGPRAGARSIMGYGDQDLDTCPDQPGLPEIIALGDETPNPWGIRDRMRQWGLEIIQTAELAKADIRPFAGSTGAAVEPTVGVVGHSWGGMAAVLAASVSTDIDVMAISGASAGYGALFAPLLAPSIRQGVIDGGVPETTPGFDAIVEREVQTVVQIYTWALEPADPLYAAANIPVALPVLAQSLIVPGDNPGADLHLTTAQQDLADALTARGGTSAAVDATIECAEVGGGTDMVCYDDEDAADAMGVVGISLAPCDGDDLAARLWFGALQAQAAAYIGSAGMMTLPLASVFGADLPTCGE